MIRAACTVVLVGALAAGLSAPLPTAGAEGTPSIDLATPAGPPGSKVLVGLDGWSPGIVTVVLCGNAARRGSEDCELVTSQSVATRGGERVYVELPISAPRLPCPCVVRAFDAVTETAEPFEVVGAPTAPPVGREGIARNPIEVTARVERVAGSFGDRLRAVLGGTTRRTVVVRVHNLEDKAIRGVIVTATVGRRAGAGEILDGPPALDLDPGATEEVSLPIELTAPVHGSYVVSATAFAAGSEVAVSAEATATPWGLVVIAGLLAVDLVVAVLFTLSRRRQARVRPQGGRGMSGTRTTREHTVVGATS